MLDYTAETISTLMPVFALFGVLSAFMCGTKYFAEEPRPPLPQVFKAWLIATLAPSVMIFTIILITETMR